MPFTPPYRDYTEGDFVFGINASIANFQKSVNQARTDKIDFKATTSGNVTTVRGLSVKRSDVDTKFTGERHALNSQYLDTLESHTKFIRNSTHVFTDPDVKGNAEFRIKSKVGLHFCIVTDRYLHFVLDDLDLAGVLGKNWKKNQSGIAHKNDDRKSLVDGADKIRTVTGAELRWIYRHSLRPDVQEHVQFWYNDQQCCPPWDAAFGLVDPTAPNPMQWSAYKNPVMQHGYA